MSNLNTAELANTVQTDVVVIQEAISKIKITNEETLTTAAEILSNVKTRIKRLEDKRKEYVGPINEQVKAINEDFKKMSAPYLAAEMGIKALIGSYMDAQRKIQEDAEREERKRRQEEARKLAEAENISTQKAAAQIRKEEEIKAAEAPKVAKPVTAVSAPGAKMATKFVMKFEITNPENVPDEYKVIDERLIRQAVALGAKRIAGVKIWEESQIVGYTK